jgi:hypothetical protein
MEDLSIGSSMALASLAAGCSECSPRLGYGQTSGLHFFAGWGAFRPGGGLIPKRLKSQLPGIETYIETLLNTALGMPDDVRPLWSTVPAQLSTNA